MAQQRFITLTTDFGAGDHYVGAMKGVVYGINPAAQVVDISHAVSSYDILDGALTIAQAYSYFPADTIHVVVVDPGVGSARRPIVARTEKYLFVAPDNGVLSLAYEREERVHVHEITSEHYFHQPVSQTFHGRDVFAAIAGWLSKGVEFSNLGAEITDYARFRMPKPTRVENGAIQGVVLKVDKFGNVVTNITPQDVPQLFSAEPPQFKILIRKHEITSLQKAYADGAPGEVFGILGSMGFLELSTNRGSAARALEVGKGAEVVVSGKW
jgi:S-adenosyl-L-methionine hydrolase (adenosine-forming)